PGEADVGWRIHVTQPGPLGTPIIIQAINVFIPRRMTHRRIGEKIGWAWRSYSSIPVVVPCCDEAIKGVGPMGAGWDASVRSRIERRRGVGRVGGRLSIGEVWFGPSGLAERVVSGKGDRASRCGDGEVRRRITNRPIVGLDGIGEFSRAAHIRMGRFSGR